MVSTISIEDRDQANQHFDRSLSLDIRGKLDDALAEMEKAIAADPNFAEAYNKLGDYFLKKGWVNKAINMFQKSAELKPEVENSHFDLGCAYTHVGRFSEALYEFEKALSIDPNHYEIYGRRGHVFLEMSLYAEAIDNLKKALVKDPSDIMARFTLGVALLKVNRNPDAHQQFEKVIEHYVVICQVKERYAEGNYYIGRAYFFMQKFDLAVEYLKKAVEYDTDDVDYHFSFGMFYTDADALCALAEALAASNDKTAAREYLQKAIDLDPQNQRFQDMQRGLS